MSKSKMGRPRKYEADDVAEFERRIEDYFGECDRGEVVESLDKKTGRAVSTVRRIPYTIQGLARALGFNDRHALDRYETHDEHFSSAIKKARARIEEQRVTAMLNGDANMIGSIFYLKSLCGLREADKDSDSGSIVVTIDHRIGIPSEQCIIKATPQKKAALPAAWSGGISIDVDTLEVSKIEDLQKVGEKLPSS